MEDKQLTPAQIQELWEWCGWTHLPYKGDALLGKLRDACWIEPGEIEQRPGNWHFDLPPVDLNNLFKYAAPKLQDKGHQVELLGFEHKGYRATVYEDGFTQDGAGNYEPFIQPMEQATDNDPALALFWAIWKVIQQEKK